MIAMNIKTVANSEFLLSLGGRCACARLLFYFYFFLLLFCCWNFNNTIFVAAEYSERSSHLPDTSRDYCYTRGLWFSCFFLPFILALCFACALFHAPLWALWFVYCKWNKKDTEEMAFSSNRLTFFAVVDFQIIKCKWQIVYFYAHFF